MDEQNNRNLLKQAILDGISQKYEEELSATQEFLLYSKRLERKRRRMKRFLLVMVVVIMASAALAASLAYLAGSVRGTVMQVTEDGRAVLDIMPQKLLEELSVGDTALVKIGSFKAEMPLAEELIPKEDELQLLLDRENGSVLICSYHEDVCEQYGIRVGDRVIIWKIRN
jgi:hypothetical protein